MHLSKDDVHGATDGEPADWALVEAQSALLAADDVAAGQELDASLIVHAHHTLYGYTLTTDKKNVRLDTS